jgi:hypothetical protein
MVIKMSQEEKIQQLEEKVRELYAKRDSLSKNAVVDRRKLEVKADKIKLQIQDLKSGVASSGKADDEEENQGNITVGANPQDKQWQQTGKRVCYLNAGKKR